MSKSMNPVAVRRLTAAATALALLLGYAGLSVANPAPASASAYSDSVQSVLSYIPADHGAYVGSPTLEVLSDGTYLAASTRFGGGADGYGPQGKRFTEVFRSTDKGANWNRVAIVEPMFWATIFELGDAVYLMGSGSAEEYDNAVISKSTDGGLTWTTPTILLNGLYTTGDTPVAIANGRVYKTFEHYMNTSWGDFRALVISAPVGADLLDPASWTRTNDGSTTLVVEGNAVVDRDGNVLDIQRWHDHPTQTFWERISPDGTTLTELGGVNWPRGVSINKFYILWDEVSQRYLMVGNPETEASSSTHQRNVLALYESPNLKNWRFVRTLVEDDQGLTWANSILGSAFSQPTIQIDGDRLLVVSRTADKFANSNHNTNKMTFHAFPDFRLWLGQGDEVAHYGFDSAGSLGVDSSPSEGTDAVQVAGSYTASGKIGGAYTPAAGGLDLGYLLHPTLWNTGGLSAAAWIKTPATIPSNGVILQTPIDGTTTGFELSVRGTGDANPQTLRVEVRPSTSSAAVVRYVPYPTDGAWHHVAASAGLTTDSLHIYIDGVEVAPAGASVSFGSDEYKVSNNPVSHDRIGSATSGALFPGSIDDVRVFRTALSTASIQKLLAPAALSLTGIGVDGDAYAPFTATSDVHEVSIPGADADLTFPTEAGVTASPAARSIAGLAPGASTVVDVTLSDGETTAHQSVRVSRPALPDTRTTLSQIALSGAQSIYPVDGTTSYQVTVGALPSATPPQVTIQTGIARSPKATVQVLSQPVMTDAVPTGTLKVTSESGASQIYTVTVAIVRDALVGHWSFDQRNSSVYADSSVFGRTATATASSIAGPVGAGAIRLGGSARVVLGSSNLDKTLKGASAISVAGWIHPEALPTSGTAENDFVFATRVNAASAGVDVLFEGPKLRVAGRSASTDGYQKRTFSYPNDGRWHHIVASVDYAAKVTRLWIDGVEATPDQTAPLAFGQSSYQSGTSSNPDTIGGSPSGGGFFTGGIDDFSVYGRLLTGPEITAAATPDAPPVSAVASPAAPEESGWYTSPASVAYQLGVLAGAPAAAVQYRDSDDGDWTTLPASPAGLTNPVEYADGEHTIEYRSSQGDKVGATSTTVVRVDSVAPEVSATTAVVAGAGTITLSASDATSGVAAIEYRTSDSAPWSVYSGRLSYSDAGTHSVSFRAVDAAGNASAPQTVSVDTPLASFAVSVVPVVSGAAVVGGSLSVSDGEYSVAGVSVSRQWLAGG
ncbi:hypothetical protein QT381_15695, partial [Galbitalea sp. SE-J8]|uniref:LamG-like jellyroll fold domain-containing protein n=1 Tax=Galbitalea sp. SE-J8 TaxID=3054952 RepID=UPI002A46F5F9|nr:hypothetical protein [Galbitalea sp. SE-J8]